MRTSGRQKLEPIVGTTVIKLEKWRPLRDLNPCRRRERAATKADFRAKSNTLAPPHATKHQWLTATSWNEIPQPSALCSPMGYGAFTQPLKGTEL